MSRITESTTRTIVRDFATRIDQRKEDTPVPSKTVIDFRTDRTDRYERPIYRVPIELLRYRKDNGRIASDIQDHERTKGPLDETNEQDQAIIAHFLREKNPERTEALKRSIVHAKQKDPAIVTCDGFLINGNRRKMVIEALKNEYPNDPDYSYMKVVILPGDNDRGGPPTLLQIEMIENRYQLQSDGRAEYYGFDRALSITRKIEIGLSLRDQLLDDPEYATATPTEMKRAVTTYEKEYLEPLKAVDRYLEQYGRAGQYRTISSGASDPQGRWQAFKDYSTRAYTNCFQNAKTRIKLKIREDEVGKLETAAFHIIRLRDLPTLPKVHNIMRDLPNYCRTPEGKKAILRIADKVAPLLPDNECHSDGRPFSPEAIDAKSAAKHKEDIIYYTKRAAASHEITKDKDTPLDLLDAAHKKLVHEDMNFDKVRPADYKKARSLVTTIQERAAALESELYHREKKWKKLSSTSRP